MSKSEYSNRVALIVDPANKDATITFFNVTQAFDSNLKPISNEAFEVAKIVMTKDNMIALRDMMNNILEQIDIDTTKNK